MNNFKSLFINVTAATAMAVGAIGLAGGNAAEARSLPHYNQPINGGTTTLVRKCLIFRRAQNDLDFVRMAQVAFQIGFEHDVPNLSEVKDDCSSVGVYGIW